MLRADRRVARTPSRERGLIRFANLVDATERLLERKDPHEVGLYQIAEEAGVPPASAYHFFPSKEAAFFALAQRYLQGFRNLVVAPIEAARLRSWQDLMGTVHERGVEYYNQHLPAQKILLGGSPTLDIRQADQSLNTEIARNFVIHYDSVFFMPYVRDAERMFHTVLGICDAIWAISYVRHQHITPDYVGEALTACIAFARTYLPERVEVRDHVREAARRGERVHLGPKPQAL